MNTLVTYFVHRCRHMLVASLLAGPPLLLAQPPQSPRIVPNGPVYSLLHQGDTTYYGGQFTQAGYYSAYLGQVRLDDAIPQQAFPMANGPIEVVLPDGNGGWYVGGGFTQIADQSRSYLAHILPDGSLDASFSPQPNGQVYALDKLDGRLYVGGSFTQIGGQSQAYLAALEIAQQGALAPWQPQLNGAVRSLTAAPPATLYAGGSFSEVNGLPQPYLVELTLDSARVVPTPSVNSTVETLVVEGDALYVGGSFSKAGNYSPYLALLSPQEDEPDRRFPRFNGSVRTIIPDGNGGYYAGGSFTQVAGQNQAYLVHLFSDFSIDPAFNPQPNGAVEVLQLTGNFLYVGGSFSQIGGQAQGYIARLDLSQNGAITSWSPGLNGAVYTIHAHPNPAYLYVGGSFTEVNGQRQQYMATLETAGSGMLQMPSANSTVYAIEDHPSISGGTGLTYVGGAFSATGFYAPFAALLAAGGDLPSLDFPAVNGYIEVIIGDGNGGWYLGGSFTQVEGQNRPYLAHVTSSLSLDPTFLPAPNNTVRSLWLEGNTLYVGGDFTQIGGHSMQGVAALDAGSGQILPAWQNNSLATGTNGSVRSLILGGGVIYLGGSFTQLNGQSRAYLASVNPANGGVLGFNPGANAVVYDLAYQGGTLYAGGSFNQVAGQSQLYLAALDGAGQLVPGFAPQANGTVLALDAYNGQLWVGGNFTQIGGQPRNRLAQVNFLTGLATTWNPNANGSVWTIESGYVAGNFTQVGGFSQAYVAAFQSNGSLIGWNPQVNSSVRAIWHGGSQTLIGGQFTYTRYQARNYLTALDPIQNSNLTDWNPQANGIVRCLQLSGNLLFVGGNFTQIGGQPRNRLAVLDPGLGAAAGVWNPNANGSVEALAIRNDTVYVAGQFTEMSGSSRRYAAALTYSPTPTPNLLAWDPQANSSGLALCLDGNRLLLGGSFTYLQHVGRSYLLAMNTLSRKVNTWNPAPNGVVYTLASDGTHLYVGGHFSQVAGQPRPSLGRFSLSDGSYDLNWDVGFPDAGTRIVYDLAITPTAILAGGAFEEDIQTEFRAHAAAFEPANGDLMPWNPRLNLSVKAIGVSGSDILLGGSFSLFDVHFQQNLLAVDESKNEIIRSWTATANGQVRALARLGSHLYIGGSFSQVSGQARSNLARVQVLDGQPDSWNPGPNAQVLALEAWDGALYAGGSFTQVRDISRPYLAAFSPNHDVPLSWNPAPDHAVYALAGTGNHIYAGGSFTQIDGQARTGLAKLDDGGQLDPAFAQNTNGTVYALAATASRLYVGGSFTQIGTWSQAYAAALDLGTDNVSDWNPAPNGTVWAISPRDSLVVIGGAFSQAGGATARYGASVGPGKGTFLADLDLSNQVYALANSSDQVFVGGAFDATAGNRRQRYAVAFAASSLGSSNSVSIADGPAPTWRVYPNPAREAVTVEAPQGGEVQLLALDGRLIWRQGVSAGAQRLRLPALAPGLYLLRLQQEGRFHTQRLMIR
ncbi:MAG: T9SS C-terminal target domain-containing protein [Bacteroidetes bacterium]|nr:MAG: T9SS C-terminal target domain-containing protein [Bacteroidota bacterium]